MEGRALVFLLSAPSLSWNPPLCRGPRETRPGQRCPLEQKRDLGFRI
jgi:hypothetical protein